ncbi:DUF4920 domain-containing protein [Flavobacterium ardleyense]|uniref:DUF4920 domain-containing protein n=1 Tax=Flavobacterium ardleyense TaxID=2038737 RepID=A0ABW5ZA02_9FLAO
MKKIILILALTALFVCCEQKKEIAPEVEKVEYASFGVSISDEGALSKEEMMEKFATLKAGDTLDVKFRSAINEVCQKKGCWMSLNLSEDEELFVKFKDYDFFVPMNAQDKEVIVKGKAYVNVETVADLKHYAKDAGKSQALIDSIVKPEVRYSFMADGVLIAKK